MSHKTQLTGSTVKGYLKRFPNTSSLGLAKKIFKENALLFSNLEGVRSLIRIYRGAAGDANRNDTKNKEFFNQNKKKIDNPFELPASDESAWEPFVIPSPSNLLVLSDIHIPYQNNTALTAALNYGVDNKINAILLNGDSMDFYGASSFEKDPRKRRLNEEFQMTRSFLKSLRKNFPKARIYWKDGNHEERWQRMLKLKAPEILDMEEFRLDVILKMAELKIEYITDKRIIHAGKLNILHGHEFQKGMIAPVNVARGVYLKAKESTIVGHSHVQSSHSEGSLNGDIVTTYSQGCLCELHPAYAPINRWNHGFSHIKINKDGTYHVSNLKIIKGKIY